MCPYRRYRPPPSVAFYIFNGGEFSDRIHYMPSFVAAFRCLTTQSNDLPSRLSKEPRLRDQKESTITQYFAEDTKVVSRQPGSPGRISPNGTVLLTGDPLATLGILDRSQENFFS